MSAPTSTPPTHTTSAHMANIPLTHLKAQQPIQYLAGERGDEMKSIRQQQRGKNGHLLNPDKDGLVLLELEHDDMSTLLSSALQAVVAYNAAPTPAKAQEADILIDKTIRSIVQHADMEERYVYPLFASHLKGTIEGISANMIYERNVSDDNINKEMLTLLGEMKCGGNGELLEATLRKFQVVEEEHLMQEEHWFAILRRQMQAAELESLAHTIKQMKHTAVTHPHRLAPSHGTLSRLTHPVAGVVDRMVDQVMGREADKTVGGDSSTTGLIQRVGKEWEAKQPSHTQPTEVKQAQM